MGLLKRMQLQQLQLQKQKVLSSQQPSIGKSSDLKLSMDKFMKRYDVEESPTFSTVEKKVGEKAEGVLTGQLDTSMSQSQTTGYMLQTLFTHEQGTKATISPEPFAI